MLIKQLFYIGLLPAALISGCSYNPLAEKEPAPVYDSHPVVYQNPEPAKVKPPVPAPDIEIKAIEDTTSTMITPLETEPPAPAQPLLSPEQEKELAALEKPTAQDPSNTPMPPIGVPEPTATPAPLSLAMANPATGQMPTPPGALVPNPNSQPPSPFGSETAIAAPSEQAQPAPPPELEVVAPPPPPPPPPVFEPLQTFAPLSPVVGTLVLAANKSADKGNVESATATIERAIRIEPRNPTLFYKLALLRLRQSKPVLAEDLAKKSVLLAATDKQLKKHSWLLIARAREMQNNLDGAKEARKKADNF